jgi:glycosyltransferase involved in cell wall biosynthesis
LKDIEIICINDGSFDYSPEILKKYAKENSNLCVINQSNSGSGVARNKALSLAKGKYISFIDSDDYILNENALERMAKIAFDKNADVVSANMRVYQNGKLNKVQYFKYYTDIIEKGEILPEEYGIPWYHVKNIFKKSFLDENGIKFPEYLRGQDPVFLAKVLSKVDLIHMIPLDFYAYNSYDSQNKNKMDTDEKIIGYIKHYIDVICILEDSKFIKVKMDYIENLGNFLLNQELVLDKEILDDYLKKATSEDDLFFILFKLQTQILEKNTKIKKLDLRLSKEKKRLNSLLSSNSFKVTKPFRAIFRQIKKLKKILNG